MYDIFKMLLDEKGDKPADVAKETGINQTVFSEWKKGKSSPKPDKIIKIAEYFDVPLELFYNDPEKTLERFHIYKTATNNVDLVREDSTGYNIAAHKENNENWSSEEMKQIEEYKKLLLAARNNKKQS